MTKKILEILSKLPERVKESVVGKKTERTELERRAVEGAKKTMKKYRRVFERLAEHDRT